jgi:hypothetical protein
MRSDLKNRPTSIRPAGRLKPTAATAIIAADARIGRHGFEEDSSTIAIASLSQT